MGGGGRRALSRRHQGANHAVMAWRRSLKDLGRSCPNFARRYRPLSASSRPRHDTPAGKAMFQMLGGQTLGYPRAAEEMQRETGLEENFP
jgi:hypothetical protein